MPLRNGEHRVDVVETLADVQRRVDPGLQKLGVEERIVRQEDLPSPHEGRHLLQARQVAVDGGEVPVDRRRISRPAPPDLGGGPAGGRERAEEGPGTSDKDLRSTAFAALTDREYEVVEAVAEGLDNAEAAARLFMSEGTVRNHISAILAKLGLRNRTQVAVMYYRSAQAG